MWCGGRGMTKEEFKKIRPLSKEEYEVRKTQNKTNNIRVTKSSVFW